jgi:hypothetical protein
MALPLSKCAESRHRLLYRTSSSYILMPHGGVLLGKCRSISGNLCLLWKICHSSMRFLDRHYRVLKIYSGQSIKSHKSWSYHCSKYLTKDFAPYTIGGFPNRIHSLKGKQRWLRKHERLSHHKNFCMSQMILQWLLLSRILQVHRRLKERAM